MRTFRSFVSLIALSLSLHAWAQDQSGVSKTNEGAAKSETQQQDPLRRPLNSTQRKRGFKGVKETPYDKWLKQDVRWIITPAELEAFHRLSNDEERDAFVENFWVRRDPTPDTAENEFKEEHYRRIAYANEHFAAGTQGSLTDRGHIYIAWGPPDEIESHASGGLYNRDISEGAGTTSTYPFERWRYRHLEGVGDNVILEFVDACMCNEYRLTIDPNEKDALQHVTGGAPNSLLNTAGTHEFEKLETFVKATSAPPVKFKDLLARANSRITENPLPFDVHADFVRVTGDTVLVPVTIQLKNRDITFVNDDGVQRGTVQLLGRVSTITGKVVQTFEDTVQIDVPADLFANSTNNVALYWKALPLPPKMYRLDIVAKDVNGGDRYGNYGKSLRVPEFAEDRLATSSLILADLVQPVAKADIGKGNFVIGDTKIRPRVEPSNGTPPRFRRNERLNLWMQVYNLALDAKTRQPSATIEYAIANERSGKPVLDVTESTSQFTNPGEQITVQKAIALQPLEPGTYRVTITVNDAVSKQSVAPTATFVVE